jgi:hypothetical protein
MARSNPTSRRGREIPASLLHVPVRPSFFDGQLLTAADLRQEQQYLDHKRHLLNLASLGAGVVSGLAVSTDPGGSGITVSAGLAIDAWGREIILPVDTAVPWPTADRAAPRRWGVVIEVAELPGDPVPTPNGPVASAHLEGATVTVITELPAPDDARVVLRPYGKGPRRNGPRRKSA